MLYWVPSSLAGVMFDVYYRFLFILLDRVSAGFSCLFLLDRVSWFFLFLPDRVSTGLACKS